MRRILTTLWGLGVLVASLASSPAWAIGDAEAGWTNCDAATSTSSALLAPQPTNTSRIPVVEIGSVFCHEWENVDATNDSTLFKVDEDTVAVITFDPDKDQAGAAGGGEIIVRRCLGALNAAPDAQNCISVLPNSCTALNGTEGPEASQCAAMRVGTGYYYLDLTAVVADGEDAIAEIRGEAP